VKKFFVYDDEKHNGEMYVNSLRRLDAVTSEFEVEPMSHRDFASQMEELQRRQMKLSQEDETLEDSCDLDKTSIFVIDYALLNVPGQVSFLTGERVAYLTRCFSNCSYIIGLNQFGQNTFDLTLTGHPESFADLNIGSKQLDNPGLWDGEKAAFRPWYWPQVPSYLKSFQERVDDVKSHPKDPICDLLGIKDIIRFFPRKVSEFLGDNPSEATFYDFVVKSGNGLQGRDRNANADMIGRIGAARVSKWLERLVFPGQDILVDAPHLASRCPSLLKGDHSLPETWNKTASFGSFKEVNLDHDAIEEFRFKKHMWLSRPAWLWGKLSEYRKIREISEPWKREETRYQFCEDMSGFLEKERCRDFVAESDSPYVRRFLRYFEDVEYRPKVRLFQ